MKKSYSFRDACEDFLIKNLYGDRYDRNTKVDEIEEPIYMKILERNLKKKKK